MPDLLTISIACVLNIIFNTLYQRYSKKRRIYCNDEGWLPIETLPANTKIDILLTDGETVRSCWMVDYNKKGEVRFDLYGKVATHWRRYPLPPMNIKITQD